jgi:hypothetical protein
MEKTNYLTVEVASQRGYTQVKINGSTDYKGKIDAFRNAPLMDVLAARIELLKLLRILDDAISTEYKEEE